MQGKVWQRWWWRRFCFPPRGMEPYRKRPLLNSNPPSRSGESELGPRRCCTHICSKTCSEALVFWGSRKRPPDLNPQNKKTETDCFRSGPGDFKRDNGPNHRFPERGRHSAWTSGRGLGGFCACGAPWCLGAFWRGADGFST